MKLLDDALKYCKDVIDDAEITTDEVKQQCKKFLYDYEIKQHEDNFEFFLCAKKLKIINNLLKIINYATGFVAGKSVYDGIVGFQALILVAIFGWRYKNDKNKFRYRDVVLFIPRKNAKTFLIALIFILLMLTEQNFSEFYSVCIDRDLAKEVRKAMAQIITASPALEKHFFVSESEIGVIKCTLTHSFYYPRTSKANKNNSIRPAAVCADEVGAFTSNDNIQAMRKGQLSVKNPLMFKTTTAYAESDSIMLEELEYDRAVLEGTVTNERIFILLYYALREEVWDDMAIYKANPLRVEENYEEIKSDREIAKIKISEQEELLTKNFNIFLDTNELDKYLDIRYWKKCEVDNINFEGKEVIVGVDLSVTTDLTAVSIMYREDNKIYCKSHGFLPEDSLAERRENIDYRNYAELGYCDIHKGMTVSYTKVEEYIRSIEETYNCKIISIVTDPMNAKEMMERLSEDFDVIMLKQTYTNLSPATKEFRKLVYDGNVFYEKNELLDWNMKNAITTKGKADDEMLQKENKNKQRIDMVAVLIFGMTQLIVEEEKYSAVDTLDKMDW
ncbi:terminase large subunit [Clostridium beijerinckii]|uniref:terminase large subunit n=1 Tax=Clostridium beijerinckii TaxID=1520 RepID=UPI00098CAC29|nr:terminase TerL endonuclease subunit [Clostridium beijerinckii]MBA8936485.1 phage terminase large subunit-like protein [Clostridium beijerinckii]NRU41047.1 phage terminase large subunit-like protein [Clostridium beijerinckii]NSA95678.1 phage terminase large subunit-like protein [Clostridium beijerinckii]OOM67039.1 phage terminase [Clostridium beijerinckii]OOM70555.1 phage terminase [Clostridium beijerinckii]